MAKDFCLAARKIETGTTGETGAIGGTAGTLMRAENGDGLSAAKAKIENARIRTSWNRTLLFHRLCHFSLAAPLLSGVLLKHKVETKKD